MIKCLCVNIIILVFFVSSVFSQSSKPDTWDDNIAIWANMKKIVDRRIEILASIKIEATELSMEQYQAITELGELRATQAIPELIRITHLKWHGAVERDGKLYYPQREPLEIRMGEIHGMAHEYPAVKALINIGLPAVTAIIEKVSDNGDKEILEEKMRIYAAIVYRVLGTTTRSHAEDYVRREQAMAPEKSKPQFDKLISQFDKLAKPLPPSLMPKDKPEDKKNP